MRALSLWQPWASAIALLLKKVETRDWYTPYRGPLAIHAAKRWTREEREFVADRQHFNLFPKAIEIPLGAIVAVVNLDDCRPTEQLLPFIDEIEESWGNYGPGRFGFVMSNIQPLPTPVPFKGAQGFFHVPDHILTDGTGIIITPPPDAQGKLL